MIKMKKIEVNQDFLYLVRCIQTNNSNANLTNVKALKDVFDYEVFGKYGSYTINASKVENRVKVAPMQGIKPYKFTEEEKIKIIDDYNTGEYSKRGLAKKWKCSDATVRRIINAER